MKLTFFKGCHYCFPFPIPILKFGNNLELDKTVKFTNNCKYELPGEDQNDVNKLFGISYGYHHVNSDRIGFRYNLEVDKMELVLYSYVDKIRIPTIHLCYIELNQEINVKLKISIEDNSRDIEVEVKCQEEILKKIKLTKKCNISSNIRYTLGGYFGGNRTSPHYMNYYIKNTKI